MEGLFIFFIIVIMFNVLSSASKKAGPKKRHKQPWKPSGDAMSPTERGRKSLEAKGVDAAQTWARQKAARELKHKIQDYKDGRSDKVRNPGDKNRNRSYDWGSRQGPGLLTGRNVILFIGLGLIALYILSRIPADLGMN